MTGDQAALGLISVELFQGGAVFLLLAVRVGRLLGAVSWLTIEFRCWRTRKVFLQAELAEQKREIDARSRCREESFYFLYWDWGFYYWVFVRLGTDHHGPVYQAQKGITRS